MTSDEFLDREKQRGMTIYRCIVEGCPFRGMGASTVYHEINHEGHQTYNEAKPELKEQYLNNRLED